MTSIARQQVTNLMSALASKEQLDITEIVDIIQRCEDIIESIAPLGKVSALEVELYESLVSTLALVRHKVPSEESCIIESAERALRSHLTLKRKALNAQPNKIRFEALPNHEIAGAGKLQPNATHRLNQAYLIKPKQLRSQTRLSPSALSTQLGVRGLPSSTLWRRS